MFKSVPKSRKPQATVNFQFGIHSLTPNDLITSRVIPLGLAGSFYYYLN